MPELRSEVPAECGWRAVSTARIVLTDEGSMKPLGVPDDPRELMPVTLVDALADLQPLLQRARRGGWRIMALGARTSEERTAAAQLSDRMMRLAEAMEAGE
jgi:hypothetical protein